MIFLRIKSQIVRIARVLLAKNISGLFFRIIRYCNGRLSQKTAESIDINLNFMINTFTCLSWIKLRECLGILNEERRLVQWPISSTSGYTRRLSLIILLFPQIKVQFDSQPLLCLFLSFLVQKYLPSPLSLQISTYVASNNYKGLRSILMFDHPLPVWVMNFICRTKALGWLFLRISKLDI